ncbi:MAG: ABC transporter permease [Melioribacteraceae bacterium]
MLLSYFKIAFRNIRRHKGHSAVNILGLSVGLACVILISMIIKNELSYDQFHEKKDRIFRVFVENNQDGKKVESAPVMLPFAPAAKAVIPEIEEAVRTSQGGVLCSYNEKRFYEPILYVENKFFNLFSFPFAKGDKARALNNPNTVVISQRIAEKYFGKENPIGKSFVFDNKNAFIITGVIYNLPLTTHLRGDIFVSFSTLNNEMLPRLNEWGNFGNDYAYLLLKPNTNSLFVEKKLNNVMISNTSEYYHDRFRMTMQPLSEVHFSDFVNDDARTTPQMILYVFALIGLFILILAVINFINLTTARSSRRNKEIGIRKAVGASRAQLIKQFLSESFVITLLAFLLAIGLTYLLVNYINELLRMELSLALLISKENILVLLIILVLTSLMAGFYPAFILSKPIPSEVLKSSSGKRKGYKLRASLVVFQFAISVFLIIGTITVFKQTNYLMNRDIGFPSDRMLVVVNNDPAISSNGAVYKRLLLNNENIETASFSSGTPGSNIASVSNFSIEGKGEDDELMLQVINVDYDFLTAYNFKMKSGRFFSPEFATDSTDTYVINEAAAKKMIGVNPLQSRITSGSGGDPDSKYCKIIGVMQNFNYRSLKKEIDPMIFKLKNNEGNFLTLKIKQEYIASTVDFIKQTTAKISPAYPFDFFFTRERFESYYRGETVLGKMFLLFSGLAIFISCIGILGLVSFSTEQRSKEIGIRKVLGASVQAIVFMLCQEFLKWVLISNILIWPLAYLLMTKWLNSFAYRIDFSVMTFVLTFLISLFVTLATVSFHAVKAAVANPVDSLKYE